MAKKTKSHSHTNLEKKIISRRDELFILFKALPIDASMDRVYDYVIGEIKAAGNLGDTESRVSLITNAVIKSATKNKVFRKSLEEVPWATINALLNNIILIFASALSSISDEDYNEYVDGLKKQIVDLGKPTRDKKHDVMFN